MCVCVFIFEYVCLCVYGGVCSVGTCGCTHGVNIRLHTQWSLYIYMKLALFFGIQIHRVITICHTPQKDTVTYFTTSYIYTV